MINRLLALLTGEERSDNKLISQSQLEVFQFYSYLQIIKPLVSNDYKRMAEKNSTTKSKIASSLSIKYGLTPIQITRIIEEYQNTTFRTQ